MKFFGECDMKKFSIEFDWILTGWETIEAETEEEAIKKFTQYIKEGESPSRWLPDDDAFLDIKSVKLTAN